MPPYSRVWLCLRRIGANPVAFRPAFMTLVLVACVGIFFPAGLVCAQSSPWQSVGTGDCPGQDVSSSTGPAPDPAKCDAAFAGFTAVCWSGACTYKNVATASCTGGASPGRMYRCAPSAPPPPPSSTPVTTDDLGTTWKVDEFNAWFGTWTRRPGTNVFDAVWKNRKDQVLKDTIQLVSVEGNKVSLYRLGNKQTYTGVIAADGEHITGTASLYVPGQTWTATINRVMAAAQSIVGEWEFYRGGLAGTPDEDKTAGSGMLVIWDENGAHRGRLAFEKRQTWEELPDLAFDKDVLTFTRAPTQRRPVPQYFRAVLSGDKLAGTVKQDSQTRKWWGTKMKRGTPSVP